MRFAPASCSAWAVAQAMERLFATPKMIPFFSVYLCALRCDQFATQSTQRYAEVAEEVLSGGAFGRRDQCFVLAALYPLQYLRHAPDWKRVTQPGSNRVGPEAIQSFLVVVFLKVACLCEKLIVINSRSESSAAQLHHRAADDVCVLSHEQGRAIARQFSAPGPGQ